MHSVIVVGRGQAGTWAGFAEAADREDLARVVGDAAFEKVLQAGYSHNAIVACEDSGAPFTVEGQDGTTAARLADDGWMLVTIVLDGAEGEEGEPYPDESDLDSDEAVAAYCTVPEAA